jgi:hypothetical protein
VITSLGPLSRKGASYGQDRNHQARRHICRPPARHLLGHARRDGPRVRPVRAGLAPAEPVRTQRSQRHHGARARRARGCKLDHHRGRVARRGGKGRIVTLANGVLTIKGEKKQQKEEKGESYHLTERSYGSFRRSLRLPDTVDDAKVEARFEKGVLKVTAAKKPEAVKAQRSIEIKKG